MLKVAIPLIATSPAWSLYSENSGAIHGCEDTPADSFDGSLHDISAPVCFLHERSWLLCVSFDLSSPTWAGYMGGCGGDGAEWQAGECQLLPAPQSKSPSQMPGLPQLPNSTRPGEQEWLLGVINGGAH